MNEIVRNVASLLEYDMRKCGVSVDLDLTSGLANVNVDEVQIEQIILNLCRNAIESIGSHKKSNHRLKIQTRSGSDSTIRVIVRDSGSGMPEEMRHKLFDPFNSTKQEGLGLGLSISRSIIESHDGHIWLEETGPGGTDIRFDLPKANDQG